MADFSKATLPAQINAGQRGGYLDPQFLLDGMETAVNLNELLQYILDNLGASGEANTASNLGTGQGIFASKVASDLRFKSLVAGTNVTISADGNAITISAAGGGGETNTASNLGTGQGIFASKVASDLRFKSLVAGTNVTISSTGNAITISAAGGGAGLEQYEAEAVGGADGGCYITCTKIGATFARTGGAGQNTEGVLTIPEGSILKGIAVHFDAAQAPGNTYFLNIDRPYSGPITPPWLGENDAMPPLLTVTSRPVGFSDVVPATSYVHSGTPLQYGIAQINDNGSRIRIRLKVTNYNQQVGANASILSVIFP